MAIVITGGSGFLGHRLAKELRNSSETADKKIVVFDTAAPESSKQIPGVTYIVGSINDEVKLRKIVTADVECVYHLAAVLSGGAEADYDLGMKVNIDGTRALIGACRAAGQSPRFVLAGTIAVFGKAPSAESMDFTENSPLSPQSSYGTEKAMCELLIADASRRGFIDGVSVRLPTITVRPGRPNSAASSFVSGIIREPLQGVPAVCPVDPSLPLWVQSPRVAIENLIHARTVDLAGSSRIITLPGITTTPKEMIEALEDAGGDTTLIKWEKDSVVNNILSSWPGSIATPIALGLGFRADLTIKHIVQAYIDDDLPK